MARAVVTSHSRIERKRCRTVVEGRRASVCWCSSPSAGVANLPKARNLETYNGAEWTGSIDSSGRKGRRYGCGLQMNVLLRMSPRSPGGAVAAIETATGPEKDSPSNA